MPWKKGQWVDEGTEDSGVTRVGWRMVFTRIFVARRPQPPPDIVVIAVEKEKKKGLQLSAAILGTIGAMVGMYYTFPATPVQMVEAGIWILALWLCAAVIWMILFMVRGVVGISREWLWLAAKRGVIFLLMTETIVAMEYFGKVYYPESFMAASEQTRNR